MAKSKYLVPLFLLPVSWGASAAIIKTTPNSQGLSGVYSSVEAATDNLLTTLLDPSSPIFGVLATIGFFLGFMVFAKTMVDYVMQNADVIDVFFVLLFISLSAGLISIPYGGEPSVYVYLARAIQGFNIGLGQSIVQTISGNSFSTMDTWLFGMRDNYSYDIALNWSVAATSVSILITEAAWTFFMVVYFFCDLGIPILLACVLVLGPLTATMFFFDWGVKLAVSWLNMVLSLIIGYSASKLIASMAVLTWADYLGLNDFSHSFWVNNQITIQVDQVSQTGPMVLIPFLFGCIMFGSLILARGLTSAALTSTGIGQGVAVLALASRMAKGR